MGNDYNNNNSLEKRINGNHEIRLKRNIFFLTGLKIFGWPIIKTRSYKYYEIPEETHDLMERQKKKRDISILYIAPHRSMWETAGIPYSISWHDGDIPFIMMGNNLVKKDTGKGERRLKYILDRSGAVSVERETNPRTAVHMIISDISKILSINRNVLLFAEGTRSRDGLMRNFMNAGFEGAIRAVSGGKDVYIVPVNVDYSKLIEWEDFAGNNELLRLKPLMLSEEFVGWKNSQRIETMRDMYNATRFAPEEKYKKLEDMVYSGNSDFKSQWDEFQEKYTFRIRDIKSKWKTFIGDTDVSFGAPIHVENTTDRSYRGLLAEKTREACMNLVKIHKINVLSEAIVRMNPKFGTPILAYELYPYILDVMKDLSPHEDKLRHFSILTRPGDIARAPYIEIDSEMLEGYKIYANQISHYLPKK